MAKDIRRRPRRGVVVKLQPAWHAQRERDKAAGPRCPDHTALATVLRDLAIVLLELAAALTRPRR
jgi:hypothetical protein